jgi:pimeloyl-ACP methyl ester carboxylesterase
VSNGRLANQSIAAGQEVFTTGSVASNDGTTIGYRQLGHGPGLVVVHGAMSWGQTHLQLGQSLADDFTVYLLDRRGRGQSGPFGDDYSIRKEVEDLDAVLAKTGAQRVFGVSMGAIVTLQHALSRPAIRKAAIFEPPLLLPAAADVMARYDREMGQGRVAAALTTALKATQMGPPIFNLIPRWLLERLTNTMLASEEKKAKAGDVTMKTLARALQYDGQLILEIGGRLEPFRSIQATVLLIGGSKSPAYLKTGHDALEKILPHVERVELPGLGHAASWNSERGGKPEPVARELRRFFAGD